MGIKLSDSHLNSALYQLQVYDGRIVMTYKAGRWCLQAVYLVL